MEFVASFLWSESRRREGDGKRRRRRRQSREILKFTYLVKKKRYLILVKILNYMYYRNLITYSNCIKKIKLNLRKLVINYNIVIKLLFY